MIAAMGPLYGSLLGQDVSSYLPYLAVSLVTWQLLAGLTTDSCSSFIGAESYIKNVKLPLTAHVLRVVWRNFIVFGHNLLIVLVVLVIFGPTISWHILEVPIGLALIAANAVWLGLMLGALSARFRDIPQIVASLVQVAFFLTPVLWTAGMLGRNAWAATINPFFHFLEIVRQPVLGQSASIHSWLVVLAVTLVGYSASLAFFSRFRARIAYWV
jgi:ABC-type polysaccharide/polyol phosphate export permease